MGYMPESFTFQCNTISVTNPARVVTLLLDVHDHRGHDLRMQPNRSIVSQVRWARARWPELADAEIRKLLNVGWCDMMRSRKRPRSRRRDSHGRMWLLPAGITAESSVADVRAHLRKVLTLAPAPALDEVLGHPVFDAFLRHAQRTDMPPSLVLEAVLEHACAAPVSVLQEMALQILRREAAEKS